VIHAYEDVEGQGPDLGARAIFALGGVRLQLHIVTEMELKSEYEVGVR